MNAVPTGLHRPEPGQSVDAAETDAIIKRELRRISESDNWHAIGYLAADYLIVASVTVLCLTVSMWFYPLAWLVIGTRQRGLANLMHAASHNTLARNKVLNFVLGTFFSGYLVGQRFVAYSYSHVTNHHGHLGDAVKDPDYKQHLDLGLYEADRRGFFWRFVTLPLMGGKIPQYIVYVLRERLVLKVPAKFDNKIVSQRTDALLLAATWASILVPAVLLGFLDVVFLFWIVPLFSSAMIIGWFIEMAEHYPLVGEPDRSRLHLSRNRHGNAFEMMLTGVHYDNYHLEHHLNPRIPMWHLKASNVVRLMDPRYRAWDEQWGGIFTCKDRLPTRKTFFEYVAGTHFGSETPPACNGALSDVRVS